MNIIKFDNLDSTNNYLKLHYKKLKNFDVCFASFQTNGKGRNVHVWESEKGKNLTFSILIKDKKIISKFNLITLWIGYIVFKFLRSFNINNVSIKWPNDVYVNDKKICGVLSESISVGDKMEALILGIGININQKKFIVENATSLSSLTQKEYDLETTLNSFLSLFEIEILNYIKNPVYFISDLNNNNYLLNKKGVVYLHNQKKEVVIGEINIDGSINVFINKVKNIIYTGEIILKK